MAGHLIAEWATQGVLSLIEAQTQVVAAETQGTLISAVGVSRKMGDSR